MNKLVICLLFLLGAAEIAWSILAAIHHHILEPSFARAFDVSKLTLEQQHVLGQFDDTADAGYVVLFGIATILIALFFWVAETTKKPEAG